MVVWKMKRSKKWSTDLGAHCQQIWEEFADETHDAMFDDSKFLMPCFSTLNYQKHPKTVNFGMFCDLHTREPSFVQPCLKLNCPGCVYTLCRCVRSLKNLAKRFTYDFVG